MMSDLGSKRYDDGSIVSSADDWDSKNYRDYGLFYPVVGVVLRVYPSDHDNNKSALENSLLRGYYWEADVAVVLDTTEGKTVLKHVVIAPQGPSGIDNFTQDIPRPSRFLVDGTEFNGSLINVDISKLDGDRCLIHFIGGKVNQAVMTSWYPHPANNRDPSTSGNSLGSLVQGTPHLYRRNGTAMSITNEGSVYIDTNDAASTIEGSPSGYKRRTVGYGGDVQIDLKPSAKIEINTNERVFAHVNEASILQPNPPELEASVGERPIDNSSLYMDANSIVASAGGILKLLTMTSNIYITPGSGLYFGNEGSAENLVLGQVWKTKMTTLLESIVSFMEQFMSHTHSTGTGPSGPPLPPEVGGPDGVDTLIPDVQDFIDTIDDALSDYIYGSKEPPDPVDLELYDREEETGEGA